MAEEADGIGDVATVLELVRLGEDRPRPLRPDEIVELVDRAGSAELWRGCITLLQGWLRGCTQPEVLDAVVRRLRRHSKPRPPGAGSPPNCWSRR
jgi:hypothetical protein